MSEHVYKVTEIVGSSTQSFQDAVEHAIHEAAQSLRQIRWFEVTETRGKVADGAIAHWQVTVKIGFTMESSL